MMGTTGLFHQQKTVTKFCESLDVKVYFHSNTLTRTHIRCFSIRRPPSLPGFLSRSCPTRSSLPPRLNSRHLTAPCKSMNQRYCSGLVCHDPPLHLCIFPTSDTCPLSTGSIPPLPKPGCHPATFAACCSRHFLYPMLERYCGSCSQKSRRNRSKGNCSSSLGWYIRGQDAWGLPQ